MSLYDVEYYRSRAAKERELAEEAESREAPPHMKRWPSTMKG